MENVFMKTAPLLSNRTRFHENGLRTPAPGLDFLKTVSGFLLLKTPLMENAFMKTKVHVGVFMKMVSGSGLWGSGLSAEPRGKSDLSAEPM